MSQFKDELPLLAENLLRTYCLTERLPEKKLTKDALVTIRSHVWDENLRGLFQALKQSYMLSENTYIKPQHLNLTPHFDSHDTLIDQSHTVRAALKKHKGVVSRAAIEIGVSRSHFYKLMEAFEIPLGFGLSPLKKKQRDEREKKKANKNINK